MTQPPLHLHVFPPPRRGRLLVQGLPGRLLAVVLPVVAGLVPLTAHAQLAMPSTSSPVRPAVTQHDTGTKGTVAPPPALPGAQSSAESVIPAEKGTLDLPPTESLFDAIHRGDMTAARDALNRGADLDGHNVLGQSPLDLSIDLNRNDITFLLLSMRGSDDHGAQGRPPAVVAKAAQPQPAVAAARRARRERPATAIVDAAGAATPAAQKPQLFAGDGGAPKPSVGFLGFGNVTR